MAGWRRQFLQHPAGGTRAERGRGRVREPSTRAQCLAGRVCAAATGNSLRLYIVINRSRTCTTTGTTCSRATSHAACSAPDDSDENVMPHKRGNAKDAIRSHTSRSCQSAHSAGPGGGGGGTSRIGVCGSKTLVASQGPGRGLRGVGLALKGCCRPRGEGSRWQALPSLHLGRWAAQGWARGKGLGGAGSGGQNSLDGCFKTNALAFGTGSVSKWVRSVRAWGGNAARALCAAAAQAVSKSRPAALLEYARRRSPWPRKPPILKRCLARPGAWW